MILDGPNPTPEELDEWLKKMIAQEEAKEAKTENE